ncbi:copper resistance CopC/CopD family protein [Streptomyces sp. CC210A]|uniref:copper resistance CopC/CopD family protein n=1 Tax=Streptomyces sp. CC210A TaxID=2898184 RepID=UPI001F1D8A2E|nr:copper resistance protein CopC [Streptomyces sp. CC210A]
MTATASRFGAFPVLSRLSVLLVLTVALLGSVLSGAASAHSTLTGSDPKDGAVVATAPQRVTLTFSEQVAMGDDSIRVLEPSGKRADVGELQDLCSGSVVQYGVGLRTGLKDGTYTVAWQAVSADSHPISGAFTFSIGAPSETTVALPAQQAGGGPVGVLYDIGRYVSYAGFTVLVGGGVFVLACWPRGAAARPVQRLVAYGWVTLTAATLALLLLRTPYTGSGELADALDLGGLQAVLATKTGAALSSRLLLMGAAALFVAVLFGAYARRGQDADKKDLEFGLAVGGAIVATGLAGTWALSEHASTGLQPGVAMPMDVLHMLAVAAWLGGLAALLVALYASPATDGDGSAPPRIGPEAVRRFSRLAFGAVVVLAATGLYQSWRQVGSWSALTGTAYGRLLLLKVALIGVLLAVAWAARRWTRLLAEPSHRGVEASPGAAGPHGTAGASHEREEGESRGSGAGRTAVLDEAPGTGDETPVTDPGTGAEPGPASEDPVRAAQLARQRAAVATARRQRLRDGDPARAGLRRSVVTEAAVAVVVLAVTTALTGTEPGRTQEQADQAKAVSSTAVPDRPVDMRLPYDTGGPDGIGTVRLTLDPGRSGGNTLRVFVTGQGDKPRDLPELKVSFTLDAQEIGPLPVELNRTATGQWQATAAQLPMPGEWRVRVTVRTSDIDQTTIDKNVKIG